MSKYRVLLVPFYCLGNFISISRLSQKGWIWVVIFLIAAAIIFIPTPLLEFLYFTPGVIIAMLHSLPVSILLYLYEYSFSIISHFVSYTLLQNNFNKGILSTF